ncbi:MAG: type I phosphomannose isomerase catalytic subunit [Bacteroidota bacterium]
MNELYPLKFKPLYLDKIWGGQKIRTVLGKDFSPLYNCGELWALSGVEDKESVVENGFLKDHLLSELIEIYMGDLVGDSVFDRFGLEFPILIKFINSEDWLSIQVHPDDEIAMKRHDSLGKTEMWYILEADKDAEVICGFKKETDLFTYKKHLEQKTLKEILNVEKALAGDVFFIPAGRVHATGPGILLAEIQQSSDITYRLYDYDRLTPEGMLRELHTESALDVIDFKAYPSYKSHVNPENNDVRVLAESPHFSVSLLEFDKLQELDYAAVDSFVAYLCLEGSFDIIYNEGEKVSVEKAEAVLIPAELKNIQLQPSVKSRILEIMIDGEQEKSL